MNDQERAIARACLEQTQLALYEARELAEFWNSLGSDVRMRWCDFQADVHAILLSLKQETLRE
jgi:hypothetical protein